MMTSRLDITQIFWDVDDFCNRWSSQWKQQKQLPSMPHEKRCRSRMSLSEVMVIVIAFHGSGFRTFKEFYTLQVLPHWKRARQLLMGVSPMSNCRKKLFPIWSATIVLSN